VLFVIGEREYCPRTSASMIWNEGCSTSTPSAGDPSWCVATWRASGWSGSTRTAA
jgi:hypothetical protein